MHEVEAAGRWRLGRCYQIRRFILTERSHCLLQHGKQTIDDCNRRHFFNYWAGGGAYQEGFAEAARKPMHLAAAGQFIDRYSAIPLPLAGIHSRRRIRCIARQRIAQFLPATNKCAETRSIVLQLRSQSIIHQHVSSSLGVPHERLLRARTAQNLVYDFASIAENQCYLSRFQVYAYGNHHGRGRPGDGAFMPTKLAVAPLALSIAIAVSLLTASASGQQILYDNGPDGDSGYYHVNFGSAVTDSFTLTAPATITNVVLTIYDVDDRNAPEHLKWTVTTEPFGGTVEGSGFVDLTRLEPPYLTQFLFFAWKVEFTVPNLELPAGTYYLQIQDVVTVWDSWAFWAQSGGGSSNAYYEAIAQHGAGEISPVPSETFSVAGEWTTQNAR